LRSRGWLLATVLSGTVALLVLLPAGASAALTASNVDTPSDGTHLFADDVAGPHTTAISGTASGASSVDIVCDDGANTHPLGGTAANVTVGGGGAFSVTDAPLDQIVGYACRLRAIEHGAPEPSDLSPFTGPKITVSGQRSSESKIVGGPNDGAQYDYYIASMLFSAGSDYQSLGSCGLDNAYLVRSTPVTGEVFYCNAFAPAFGHPHTRPSVAVDGSPAYSAYVVRVGENPSVYFSGFASRQPFPPFAYSYHIDPATHDLTINETDHFAECTPAADTFPPTSTSCTGFADAGVKLDRTIVADHGQHEARIHDRWSSTDGHSHPLTIQYENDHCLAQSTCSAHIGYRFPGEAGYTGRADDSTLTGPFPAPASIFVKDTTAPDGDPATGQGATVFSSAPNGVIFFNDSGNTGDTYNLNYDNRPVPATGSLDFQFGYAWGLTNAEVTGMAREMEDEFGSPHVAITSPPNESYTADRKVTVKGTATDSVGVSALTVNGKPVPVGAGGSFATPVTLNAGHITIAAVAKDAVGNAAQAQVAVTELLARTHKARAKKRKKAVVVDVGEALVCPAGGPACKAKLSGQSRVGASLVLAKKKGKRTLRIGRGTVKAKAGKRKELVFKLNRKGRSALKQLGKLKIKVKIDIRVGKLAHVKTTRTITVKRPKS
jgi:hypothetical protein